MGEAFLDYKKGGSGLNINGIIEDYYVYAGEKVSAGDFVEFVNGIAGKTTETSTLTKTSGVAYYDISACKLSKNKVFIASNNSNQYLYGTVCTIEGAKITSGTTTQLHSERYAGSALSVVALDENRVFVAHSINSSYMYLQGTVCAIDGTTIKIQATKQLLSGEEVGETISAQLLPSGKIFIASGGAGSDLYGTVVSVEGTTITRDSTTSLVADSTAWAFTRIATALLDDTTVCIIHNYGTADLLYGIVCTILGTTVTAGADTSICSSNYSCMFLPSVAPLGDGKVFVAHPYKTSSAYYLYGMVCTVSGTTISRGTDTNLNTYTTQSSTVALNSEKVFIAHSNGTLYGIICIINGTTITAGADTLLSSIEETGSCISALLLEDNVFVSHSYDGRRYLYARLYGVDEENLLPTTTVSIKEYETQVRPATSLPCNGVASTSGEGGDDTGHKDIVSIYTVEIPKPTNLVVNGDFSNGLEGWTLLGNATNGNSEHEITDNKIKFTMVNTFNGAFMDANLTSAVPTNNKFYIKVNYSYAGELMIIPMTSDGSTVISEIALTASASEISFSSIETANADVGLIRIGGKHKAGNVLTISNLSVYDLTAYYGSGNEPTQEWCDANL